MLVEFRQIQRLRMSFFEGVGFDFRFSVNPHLTAIASDGDEADYYRKNCSRDYCDYRVVQADAEEVDSAVSLEENIHIRESTGAEFRKAVERGALVNSRCERTYYSYGGAYHESGAVVVEKLS